MDFTLIADSPEIRDFRQEVQEWLAEHMRAGSKFINRWSASMSPRETEEEHQFRIGLARELGAKGWLFPTYPKEYGGAELTLDQLIVLEMELDRYGLELWHVVSTVAYLVAPTILKWGTEEQKRAFVPPLTRGKAIVWQCLTEPDGGCDVFACRVTAIRDGEEYVVNGEKTMVGYPHKPDYLWTFVCTDPSGPRHQNLSWIHIPADLPGITIQPLKMVIGMKNSVFFDNVRVPASYLVGGENNGWKVANTYMEGEHGIRGNLASNRLVERVAGFCQDNKRNGEPLIKDQGVRDLLADMLIESDTMRVLASRSFRLRNARQPHSYEGVQSFYFQRIAKLRMAELMQRIMGYSCLATDFSLSEAEGFEYLARQAVCHLHGAGTLDTDRVIIARRMGLGRTMKEQAPVTA